MKAGLKFYIPFWKFSSQPTWHRRQRCTCFCFPYKYCPFAGRAFLAAFGVDQRRSATLSGEWWWSGCCHEETATSPQMHRLFWHIDTLCAVVHQWHGFAASTKWRETWRAGLSGKVSFCLIHSINDDGHVLVRWRSCLLPVVLILASFSPTQNVR